MEHLPAIDSRVETARFLYGTLLRLFVQSLAYYGTRGLVSRYVLRRKDSSVWVYRSRVYMGSQAIEIGVSLLVYPMRYLAAVTTPRFILDYTLTNWSDTLRRVDLFSPGKYAAYALRAFTSDSDWNLNFFTWQVPSVALTLAKLWRRRRLLGPSSCRTARILLFFLPFQVLLRANLSSFSVMVPESGGELLDAVVSVVLEGLVTSYLALHTSPISYAEGVSKIACDTVRDGDSTSPHGDEAVSNKGKELH